jgi:hypothetical protein
MKTTTTGRWEEEANHQKTSCSPKNVDWRMSNKEQKERKGENDGEHGRRRTGE